jgi:hypothetical protein
MANELETYYNDICETIVEFGIDDNPDQLGIAMHRVYVDGSGSPSDYELTESNEAFINITGTSKEKITDFRYSNIFPEKKDEGFDWVEVLGRAGTTNARTKFYYFSEIKNKWFSILAFSLKKGYAVLVLRDITTNKLEEIKRMIAVQANASNSN